MIQTALLAWPFVITGAFAVSELLSFVPSIRANGVFQLVLRGAAGAYQNLKNKPVILEVPAAPEAPKV